MVTNRAAHIIKVNVVFSLSLSLSDFPHDLRPGQRCGAYSQLDWHDAAAVPLGRLPDLHGADAARLPLGLLGIQKQYGGGYMLIHAYSYTVHALCDMQT